MVGFYARMFSLKIVKLRNAQVFSEIDSREQAKQFELIDVGEDADIELSIVELCARRDLHAAAVVRSVGEGGDYSWPITLQPPASIGVRGRKLEREWRESRHRSGEAHCVTTMTSQPTRQLIGPPCDLTVQADPGSAAKQRALSRVRFGDYAQIDLTG